MKVSTILLTAIFTGLIGHMGPYVNIPIDHEKSRHLKKNVSINLIKTNSYDKALSITSQGDMSALKEIKRWETSLKNQIREVESAVKMIESNEQYLKSQVKNLKEHLLVMSQNDGGIKSHLLDAMESSIAGYQIELQGLDEERWIFLGLLERLKGELATLKVKRDLLDFSARKVAIEDLLGKENRSPVDDLYKEAGEDELTVISGSFHSTTR